MEEERQGHQGCVEREAGTSDQLRETEVCKGSALPLARPTFRSSHFSCVVLDKALKSSRSVSSSIKLR